MICSEGYKAFLGTMRIVPKNPSMKPYELTADWLYKPEYQCWYGKGSSFPEEICEVLVDLTAPPPNPPLTLAQLREMDGEPVWVQEIEEPKRGQWRIIKKPWYDVGLCLDSCGMLECGDMGKTWLAYRRKPGEGDV